MPDIDPRKEPRSGYRFKSDESAINIADMIESLYKTICVDKNLATQLSGSNIIQPTEIQSRYAQTIQTHNAVSVGASGTSLGNWIDCDGFTEICATLMNDAGTTSGAWLDYSNDGISVHGSDVSNIIATHAQRIKVGVSKPISSRYIRLSITNGDTVAHTFSAWVYLKA